MKCWLSTSSPTRETSNSLAPVADNSRFHFVRADIADMLQVRNLVEEFRPDVIMHLAAESHVDRSIDAPGEFIETNIVGTYVLLEAARTYWRRMPADRRNDFRFHHISTDEVFGSLGSEGLFTEESPYRPNSPYAASKAASDHLVKAWYHTYGLPVVISNCSNNYGPYHFPEKAYPTDDSQLSGEASRCRSMEAASMCATGCSLRIMPGRSG